MENKKIKVMHVISDLNFGGAGKYLLDICRNIDRDRFEIIAVLPEDSVLVKRINSIEGVGVLSVKGIANKSFDLGAVKEIREIIKAERPDVVHSHACLSARIAASREGVDRVFYTRHCIQPKSGLVKGFAKRFVSKMLSDKVIAVSKAIYDNLLEEGEKEEDIFFIYNGVEIPDKIYDCGAIKRKNGLDDEMVITLVGRLEDVKGQSHMLEISKSLIERTNGFKVLFVGEGSDRDGLEERVAREKLPVEFLGHIDEIDEIYSISDIVVNTSNSEALSFAIIEGFSHKKPAVAFDIEGLKEVVDNNVNGYLVEFGEYEVFAERLHELMEDKSLREQFGMKGLEKVKKKFSVHSMMRELEKIYSEV